MKLLALAVFCVAFVAASASLVGHGAGAVIAGPAGTVTTTGLGGLGLLGHGGLVAPGLLGGVGLGGPLGLGLGLGGRVGLGLGLGLGGHVGLVGSGIEGQWIPDINEKLYDDGSYRAEHHLGLGLGHGHW